MHRAHMSFSCISDFLQETFNHPLKSLEALINLISQATTVGNTRLTSVPSWTPSAFLILP